MFWNIFKPKSEKRSSTVDVDNNVYSAALPFGQLFSR